MNILPGKGCGKDLNIQGEGARFDDLDQLYQPEQLKIVKTYRFETESDPSDMAVIFLIQSNGEEKGFILNALGTYSDFDNPY